MPVCSESFVTVGNESLQRLDERGVGVEVDGDLFGKLVGVALSVDRKPNPISLAELARALVVVLLKLVDEVPVHQPPPTNFLGVDFLSHLLPPAPVRFTAGGRNVFQAASFSGV